MMHIAVTGTKGKSTTLRILQHIFMNQKKNVWGSYGIDGRYYNGKILEYRQDIENYLVVSEPSDIILTEATSFVIEENTYSKDTLDAAIFTSFDGTEHAELHSSPEIYLNIKKNIFDYVKKTGVSIICRDIPEFDQIVKDIKTKIITYGIHKDSDYVISKIETALLESRFNISYNGLDIEIKTSLIGDANMQNIAACIATAAHLYDIEIEKIVEYIESFPGIKGRGNIFRIPDINTEVIIDYAHTTGSLKHILETIKKISNKKLVCIFGCGGNKSILKRPAMGKVAEKNADLVIITNDNPRREHPKKITEDIISKIENKEKIKVILDRSQAIKTALTEHKDSVIVIAGKGNENFININGANFGYNDQETILMWALNNGLNIMRAYPYLD